jgi:hypothetical protein
MFLSFTIGLVVCQVRRTALGFFGGSNLFHAGFCNLNNERSCASLDVKVGTPFFKKSGFHGQLTK